MEIGIVIPAFARPMYLSDTIHWIDISNVPEDVHVVVVNDGCRDEYFLSVFNDLKTTRVKLTKIIRKYRGGVWEALREGLDLLKKAKILIILDCDVMLKAEWLQKLISLHMKFRDTIVSGFNANSHPVLEIADDYYVKSTIGGLNMVFSQEIYHNIVRPSFAHRGGWDFAVCRGILSCEKRFYVTRPSVMNHIGFVSIMVHDKVDIALDFV